MQFGIISAGQGIRLKNEGVTTPKPLLEIGKKPMIGRLADIFSRSGAGNVSVVVNDSDKEVTRYMTCLKKDIPGLEFKAVSTPSSMHSLFEVSRLMFPEGTEGKSEIDSRFVAATVDSVFREDAFAQFIEEFKKLPGEYDGLMAVTDFIDDEKPLYVIVDGEGFITDFTDHPVEGSKWVSGGVYGLGEKALEVLDRDMRNGVSGLRDYQRSLVKSGLRLRAFPMGKIIDVDHISDIEKAEQLIG